ncbi:MAG: N-methyl-L-tryptophan oxidase [Cyclobacteriaceae bacterium]
MSLKKYDAIVIGLGTMGSAACMQLAQKGLNVLGLEKGEIVNDRSSHSGYTRLIRKAYFEHPDYVPLLERSYALWKNLEASLNEQLFFKTGIAYFGHDTGPLLSGVQRSSSLYNIPVTHLEGNSFRPDIFRLPGKMNLLFEEDAGFLDVSRSIKGMCKMARSSGAQLRANVEVIEWKQMRDKFELSTSEGTFISDYLVVCAGAFTSDLLPQMKPQLSVTRQLLTWADMETDEMPCWVIEDEEQVGIYYGFPAYSSGYRGMKIAHHIRGESIQPNQFMNFDSRNEMEKINEVLKKYFKRSGKVQLVAPCMYTYSPDDDFIVDFLPGANEKMIIAAGFSGHGFKFAPVVGEIVSDLVVNGISSQPADFLSFNRFIS